VKGGRAGPYVLDANDSFVSTIRLAGGGIGTVHATRWATGQLNSLRVRAYGDEGAVEVDLDRSRDSYRVCHGKTRVRTMQWTEVSCRPTPTQYQRFIKAIRAGTSDVCDFANGARVQACLEASADSAREKRPMKVSL
jgi:predicted dehydrogenase